MIKSGKHEFRREMIIMTMLIYIGSMLTLGITIIAVSVFIFSGKAQEDMEFFLDSTIEKMAAEVQYLEDIVIAIRNNSMLHAFFHNNGYDRETASAQLSFNASLFSERNLVNSQYPFIECIYIFNEKGEYESNYYYPQTISVREMRNAEYEAVYRQVRNSDRQYTYLVNEEVVNLVFRLYDDNMSEMGMGMAVMNRQAIESIFRDVTGYTKGAWIVADQNGKAVLSSDSRDREEGGLEYMVSQSGTGASLNRGVADTQEGKMLVSTGQMGFGLSAAVSVARSTVYASVRTTIVTFLIIFFVLLFLIAFIVFLITCRFTSPLKVIAENIRSFGGGKLNTRLKMFGIQEFDDIGVVFNEMAGQIQDLIEQNYEKQLLVTQAQVRFLQSQINPHFMFNILAMIGMRAKMGGNDDVHSLLTAFSRLIQGKIFREGEIRIPLSEEMELVGFYLYLQSNRFRDRLTYDIRYSSDGLKNVRIPRLCIEPLVENAVSHGLELKEDCGRIEVDIRSEDERLVIQVTDDGVGFDPEEVLGNRAPEENDTKERDCDALHVHVGLANIGKLIRILYGDDYGIAIESSKGAGTCVTVTLPVDVGEEPDVEGHGSGR